jgi:hypothetical protein
MTFELHSKAEQRKNSAVTLTKILLANKRPEILPPHYRELLKILLWKITEAESQKHKTRFQSKGATECTDRGKLRHEHVYQCSKMIDVLLKARPEDVDCILKDAVACTVTMDEHYLLAKFDDDHGWDRYRKAGLVVINTETEERVI